MRSAWQWRRARVTGAALALLLAGSAARAALPPDDPALKSLTLPRPSPHWVWVNDFVFPHMADGMAYLIDADQGRYLGTLSTGYSFSRLVLPRDGKAIYSPETYFSRGTRGTRTDVVTLYDPATLAPIGEIAIPPKRSSNVPNMGNAQLTDDDRFLLIYNFNPAQSVTVVDTASRTFAGEIETAGCALIFPTGPRTFFMVCGDGGALTVTLDEHGQALSKERSGPLFDLAHDPVSEKPVRFHDRWLFVSFDGWVHPVRVTAAGLVAESRWSLATNAERAAGWRPGGVQPFAIHVASGRLYALVHRGALATHKDPGKDIWVYDLATGHRAGHIATKRPSSSIQVSQDAAPLLYSVFQDSNVFDVYDPGTGRLLRSVTEIGTSPTLLVTP
jgi:methylamine dehydrogenase heavy chain